MCNPRAVACARGTGDLTALQGRFHKIPPPQPIMRKTFLNYKLFDAIGLSKTYGPQDHQTSAYYTYAPFTRFPSPPTYNA